MGQYHKIVNIDKKQYVNPCTLGDGYKLLEFGFLGMGTMTGLAVLLACSNGRGWGDLDSEKEIIGSWAGDRIAIVGDYWEREEAEASGIPTWDMLKTEYQDMSREVARALCDDPWIKAGLLEHVAPFFGFEDWTWLFSAQEIKQKQTEIEAKEKQNSYRIAQ